MRLLVKTRGRLRQPDDGAQSARAKIPQGRARRYQPDGVVRPVPTEAPTLRWRESETAKLKPAPALTPVLAAWPAIRSPVVLKPDESPGRALALKEESVVVTKGVRRPMSKPSLTLVLEKSNPAGAPAREDNAGEPLV